MDNNTKLAIYNKYNVPYTNNQVDVDEWAKNFDAFIENDVTRGQRLKRGNSVFVALSPRYGTGWSTWNDFSAVDPVINLMVLTLKEEGKVEIENVEELYGALRIDFPNYDDYICIGSSLDNLEIKTISDKTQFRVMEYNGHECIEYKDDIQWL